MANFRELNLHAETKEVKVLGGRMYPGSSSPIKIFSFYVRRGKGQKIIDVGILDPFREITESGKAVLFFAYGTDGMG